MILSQEALMEKQIGRHRRGDRQTAGCALCDDRRSLLLGKDHLLPPPVYPVAGPGMRPHAIATDNYFKTGRTPPGTKTASTTSRGWAPWMWSSSTGIWCSS